MHPPKVLKLMSDVRPWQPTEQERDALYMDSLYYRTLERASRSSFYCSHPIHITPSYKGVSMGADLTGPMWNYDGTYSLACGSRLAEVCPSCSWRYAIDARRLASLGLRGDDVLVPSTVDDRLKLWFTTTLPEFGRVHSRRSRKDAKGGGKKARKCHPGKREFCPHDKLTVCNKVYKDEDDPNLGVPLCMECYQTEKQILANHFASQLFNRTLQNFEREVAKVMGLDRNLLPLFLNITYMKTAETQKRGAIHYHGFARIDGPIGQGSDPIFPLTGNQAVAALKAAITKTHIEKRFALGDDDPDAVEIDLRWGTEMDVVVLTSDNASYYVNYVTKYSTKGSAEAAGFAHKFCSLAQIEAIPQSACWPREMAKTCWQMADNPRFAGLTLRQHAHIWFQGTLPYEIPRLVLRLWRPKDLADKMGYRTF